MRRMMKAAPMLIHLMLLGGNPHGITVERLIYNRMTSLECLRLYYVEEARVSDVNPEAQSLQIRKTYRQ
jgi:hypothetical protein